MYQVYMHHTLCGHFQTPCYALIILLLNRYSPPLLKIIPINLIRHNHHPQQKNTPNNIKRKHRFPIITYPLRLQIRQRRLPLPACISCAGGVDIAVAVYGSGGAVELDGCFDEAGEEEDEEDKRAEHYYAGEELALGDEAEDYEDEEDAEGAGGYGVGE